MKFRNISLLAASALLSLYVLVQVAGCSTVPITGRSQLNLISDGEMLSMSSEEYKGFLKENKLSADSASTRLVKKVGGRIQGAVEKYFRDRGLASELNGYAWEFNLVQSDDLNAWCMSGGKVVFYTGILPVCQDEKGIAVVMGHEVAHAVAKHGAERMSEGLLAQMGGMALAAAVQSKPEETQALYMAAFGLGAVVLLLLGNAREREGARPALATAGFGAAAPGLWVAPAGTAIPPAAAAAALRPPALWPAPPGPAPRSQPRPRVRCRDGGQHRAPLLRRT